VYYVDICKLFIQKLFIEKLFHNCDMMQEEMREENWR